MLAFFLNACAAKGNNALKSQKEEIIKKVNMLLANLDKLDPQTITTIYEILNKIDFHSGSKAILADLVTVGYPSTEVLVSAGQHIEVLFESGAWDTIQIKVIKATTPCQPAEDKEGYKGHIPPAISQCL
jgi:hypothetical protein